LVLGRHALQKITILEKIPFYRRLLRRRVVEKNLCMKCDECTDLLDPILDLTDRLALNRSVMCEAVWGIEKPQLVVASPQIFKPFH
jgi:hypothetical protein